MTLDKMKRFSDNVFTNALSNRWSIDNLKAYLKQHLSNALFRNAYYLMASSLATSALSFVFWIIATRLYTTEAIGLAGAIIPAIAFIAELSGIGMGYGLMRFLPSAGTKSGALIGSSIVFQFFSAAAAAVIFVLGLQWWSPALSILRTNFIYFFGFAVFVTTLGQLNLIKNIFIAHSASKFVFITDLFTRIAAIVLLLIMMLVNFEGGVVASQGLANIIALLVAVFIYIAVFKKLGRPHLRFNKEAFKPILPYSLANYMGGMLNNLPGWIMPLIVLNLLSAEANAYYFIAMSISSITAMVQSSFGLSAFVESARDEKKLSVNLKSSLKTTIILQAIIFLFIVFIGRFVLLLFGAKYSENANLVLILLCASSFPSIVYAFYVAYLRVKNNLRKLLAIQTVMPALIIVLSLLFVPRWGLTGVAAAFLIGHTILALLIGLIIILERRVRKRSSNASNLP